MLWNVEVGEALSPRAQSWHNFYVTADSIEEAVEKAEAAAYAAEADLDDGTKLVAIEAKLVKTTNPI
jgi:hypothetical protein